MLAWVIAKNLAWTAYEVARALPRSSPTPFYLRAGLSERRAETGALLQKFMNYLDEDFFRRPDPEAHMSRAACAPYPPGRTPAVEEAAPLDADAARRR